MTDFAAATDRSTPGFERVALGDWIMRGALGSTGRANSATCHGDPGMPIAEAIDAVESWYGDRGGLPRVMVWDDTAPDVVAELERRGFAAATPTLVMAAPVERVRARLTAPGRLRTRIETEPPDLLREQISTERLAEIVHTDLERLFAVAADDAGDIGTGMAVVDAPLIGLFAMRSREDRQGEGAGSTVLRTLLDAGADRGCGTAWLQVEADNLRASEWYGRLGFVARTRYLYWEPLFTPDSPTGGAGDTGPRPDSSQ